MSSANAQWECFGRFLTTHPRKTCEIDGVAWEYIICGQGAPLLLLPGGLATAETSFQYILAFEHTYRVIAPTYPAAITLVAPLVDGLAEVLRVEGCAPAHVLGGSYSGLIAQALVRRHPQTVASLMLTNTGVPRPERARMTTFGLAGLAILPETTLRWLLKRCIRAFLHKKTPSQNFWRSYFVRLIDSLSRDDYLSRLKVAIDFDRNYRFERNDLSNWQRSILLIDAADDAIFTLKERATLRQLYRHTTIHSQQNSTHTASLDQAEATIALMDVFLNEQANTSD